MDDELLADILAAEREIRLEIDALEEQISVRREALRQELEQLLDEETRSLQAERAEALSQAEESALLEAEALLDEARVYALNLDYLDAPELDRVVFRHLARILPEGADDRQDEQT